MSVVSAPPAPSGLTAQGSDSSSVFLSWIDNSDNETGFEIQRSLDQSSWSLIATTVADVTSYSDTGLSQGTTYYYRVRAVNGSGGSSYTAVAGATPTTVSILTQHVAGQTFIYRPDLATSSAGSTYRYDVYRSTSGPITQANKGSATRIQRALFNNNGQLFGGNIKVSLGSAFTAANRYNSSLPMCKLPDGSQLPLYTCLATHTCTASEQAWYAIVETTTNEAIVAGVNATISSVSESPVPGAGVAPVLFASSTDATWRTQTDNKNFTITGQAGLPMAVHFLASNSGGGAPPNNLYGDYWEFFGDSSHCYQDGVQTAFCVVEQHTASPKHLIQLNPRDTIWNSNGTTAAPETRYFGLGFDLGSGPRVYNFTENRLLRMINFCISNYEIDTNQITIDGQSMGAWGATMFGLRHPELFAALFPTLPTFREYYTATSTIQPMPASSPFGTTLPAATSMLMSDGVTIWGGDGHLSDMVGYINSNHAALPFYAFAIGRNDGYSNWADVVAAVNAFEANKHGFSFYWNNGDHTTGNAGMVNVWKEFTGAKSWAHYSNQGFWLNVSYPAFSNCSFDDNIGNGSSTNGDLVGGKNIGFSWTTPTDQSLSWSTTISNNWMGGTFPTGPVLGPFSSGTVDVTPRRRQSFRPANGTTVHYSFTPFGGFTTTGSVTVDSNGQITIPSVSIVPGGGTTLSLST